MKRDLLHLVDNHKVIDLTWCDEKIAHIFEAYAAIPDAKPLATAIVTARKNQPINTTTLILRLLGFF